MILENHHRGLSIQKYIMLVCVTKGPKWHRHRQVPKTNSKLYWQSPIPKIKLQTIEEAGNNKTVYKSQAKWNVKKKQYQENKPTKRQWITHLKWTGTIKQLWNSWIWIKGRDKTKTGSAKQDCCVPIYTTQLHDILLYLSSWGVINQNITMVFG